jgi:sulfate/thiosulfate transport system permease protein
MGVLLVVPVVAIFAQALARGPGAWLESVMEPYAVRAIVLTLKVVGLAVPINIAFGVAAAWLLTRFRMRGRAVLLTLIDVPFTLSPVVSGLLFVLLFGSRGWLGEWLIAHDIRIIFAFPGLVLATVLVTLPFVARELIPLMESQGVQDEEAAAALGASGWKMFWRVTLPNIKWALLYGTLLCTARALGEFGAVSVVSGNVRGRTHTLPLHIEAVYNDYDFVAAFAAASVLVLTAGLTVASKKWIELRSHDRAARRGPEPGVAV